MTWRAATLKDLVVFQRGFDITKAAQEDGDVPVISSSGITSFHSEAKLPGPGVIVGRKGTLGTVHYSEGPYWPHDTTLWSKELNGNDPKYVYYFLQTLGLERYNVGNANPTLNRNHIHDLDISIPPTPAQRRIGEILSTYDDLIANNRRRIQLLEQSARLLYKEWFVHLRFPGHEHVKVVDGVPKGWRKDRLNEVAAINAVTLSNRFHGEIEYIDIASVTPGQINGTTRYSFEDAPGRARRVVRHGDIIWSCVRPNRESHAVIWNPPEDLIASTGFAVISPTGLPTSYLYQTLTTREFVGFLSNNAKGVAYPAVTARNFEDYRVLVPPSHMLNRYDEQIRPTLDLISVLNAQIRRLISARDLLLPRLMSGEIEV